MLTVFNVGNGDSFLLKPEGCLFEKVNLLVDTGYANQKMFSRLSDVDEFDIMITHSDRDHVGGLKDLLAKKRKNIKKIYLPFYTPELIKIRSFLKSKSKKIIKDIDWALVSDKLKLVSEGDQICNHLVILNPPKKIESIYLGKVGVELSIDDALRLLNEYGVELPIDEIINYESPIFFGKDENAQEDIFDLNRVGEINIEDRVSANRYRENSKKFVHQFFIAYSQLISRFGKNEAEKKIIELSSNQASIVFRYEYNEEHWLFTGDADKIVFNRLIEKGQNIQARYLKVPHHGSKRNMDINILRKIAPEVAIVSHNNFKGNSTDSHPNVEVIEDLKLENVDVFYTNDVKKKGEIVLQGSKGKVLNGLILFE